MRTAAQAKRDRAELRAQIAREHRKGQRAALRALREALHHARTSHKQARVDARALCRRGRLEARDAIRDRRRQVALDLRVWIVNARNAARETCRAAHAAAKERGTAKERARAALEAERAYRRELALLDRQHTARKKEIRRSSAKEKRGESDDEVRANIPAELVPLFERVKRGIKGGPRKSRSEAFMQYAEENPGEVLEVLNDRTDAVIAELERDERRARRDLRRPVPRSAYADVPF